MSTSDIYLKILEKISEVREGVSVLENEIKHIKDDVRETRQEIEGIKKQDAIQNKLLDEHILGVQTAMKQIEQERDIRTQERELIQKQILEIDIRLKKAEFVPNLINHLKAAIIWVGSISTAIVGIAKLLKLF